MCKTHEDTQRAEIVKAQNKRWYEGFKFLFIILLEISSYEKYKARINMVFICGILSLICITICVIVFEYIYNYLFLVLRIFTHFL